MKFRWTHLVAVLILGFGIMVAAACGGGDEDEGGERPVAVETAEGEPEQPSGMETPEAEEEEGEEEEEAPPVTAPAAAFAELDSYRYLIRFNVEGAGPVGGAFTFDIEGAFVKPDRHQVKVSGKLGGLDLDEESVTIGNRTWVRSNGTWVEGQATIATDEFSPSSFLEGFDASDFSVLKPTKEKINGVDSLRYNIGRADIEEIARLGALFGGDAGLEELPENFDIAIWLAEDGQWPVRMVMSGSGEVEGSDINFEFSLDVTDVNDEDIEVEPPV